MNIVTVSGVEVDLDDTGLVYSYQWGPDENGKTKWFIQLYKMGVDGPNESIYFAGAAEGYEPEIWKELKERFPTAIEYSTFKMRKLE